MSSETDRTPKVAVIGDSRPNLEELFDNISRAHRFEIADFEDVPSFLETEKRYANCQVILIPSNEFNTRALQLLGLSLVSTYTVRAAYVLAANAKKAYSALWARSRVTVTIDVDKISKLIVRHATCLPQPAAIDTQPSNDPAIGITRREHEVAILLCRGLSSKEIARHLSISPRTVEAHREHLMHKLAARNSIDLAIKYHEEFL